MKGYVKYILGDILKFILDIFGHPKFTFRLHEEVNQKNVNLFTIIVVTSQNTMKPETPG